jgi:hypothetical protein
MATRTKKLTAAAIAKMSDTDRKKAFIEESAAHKADASVPTPIADWLNAQEPSETKTKEPSKPRGVTAPTGMVNFFVDERLVAETQHKLSYMAGYTRTKTEPRIPTKDLIAAICEATKLTPAELMTSEWTFTLPQSGRVIRTELIPGREAPVAAPAPVEEAPAAPPAAKPRRSRAKATAAA